MSAPADPAEREADATADAIMRMPEGVVRRECAACERHDAEDAELQRKPAESGATPASPRAERVISSLGEGAPLPETARAFFEPRFGRDLSGVRVHTGARADEAARSVEARAFALGNDIVFRSGAFAPATDEGRRLLAHELTHTLQQGSAPGVIRTKREPGTTGDPFTILDLDEITVLTDHDLGATLAAAEARAKVEPLATALAAELPGYVSALLSEATRRGMKTTSAPTAPDGFTPEEAKKIKDAWATVPYSVTDTGEDRKTRAYAVWKKKATGWLGEKSTGTALGAARVKEIQDWVAKFEARQEWESRTGGVVPPTPPGGPAPTVPADPGAAPAEFASATITIKKGKKTTTETLGTPPSPAYRRVKQYDVTLPTASKNKYSFKDKPVASEYEYLLNDTGVGRAGAKVSTRSNIDDLFTKAGITDATTKKVMLRVSQEEGGFEAINTYDTGYVSSGFIQFITAKDGTGSLIKVLEEMKAADPTEFDAYFRTFGIDVDKKGLVVLDPASGAELRGADAVRKIMDDKRLTVVFHHAGLHSSAYMVAQLKRAKSQYYAADKTFSIAIDKTTKISGTISDVLQSEAGKVAIMDREVQRGNGNETFEKKAKEVAKKHGLTTVADVAKYEREIIPAIKNRIDVLAASDLTQPPALPAPATPTPAPSGGTP